MHKITAIVLTKNEEKNIHACLESLSWCDEVLIIDDDSTDDTIKIAKKTRKDVRIISRHLAGDFATQRYEAMKKASHEWVLFVDADEKISPQSAKEIQRFIEDESIDGLRFHRKDYFLGRWLSHGETAAVSFIRCARKTAGVWKGSVHETWEVKGSIVTCRHPILHHPHHRIADFLRSINHYTDLQSASWIHQGKKISAWEILVYPKGKFLQNYFLRRGFLDGVPGLIMALMMSFHSFLVRGKVYLSNRHSGH